MIKKGEKGSYSIDIFDKINLLLDYLINKNVLYTQLLSDKKEELTNPFGIFNLCVTLLKLIEIEVFDNPPFFYPVELL